MASDDGQRLHVGILGDEERPQELVPWADERDQGDREDDREGQRDGDAPQDGELAGAVDAGRLEQLDGQLEEELAEDEHRGCADGERQDHPQVGVTEAVVPDQQHVQRDHQQLERDGLHEQHGGEGGAAAPVVQNRQRVAGQQPEEQGAEDDSGGDDPRVDQRSEQIDAPVDVAVVLGGEVGRVGEGAAHAGVGLLLQRPDEHVVEREEEHEGTDRERQQPHDRTLVARRSRRLFGLVHHGVGGVCHFVPLSLRYLARRLTMATKITRSTPIAAA